MKARVFILEWKDFPQAIRENLQMYEDGNNLDFKSSNSEIEYKRHLPKGYDLYLLHISHTEEEAIEELRKKQPWSKIFIRDSMKRARDSMKIGLPYSIKKLIDGEYDISNHEYCKKVLESIGVSVRSLEEIYEEETA